MMSLGVQFARIAQQKLRASQTPFAQPCVGETGSPASDAMANHTTLPPTTPMKAHRKGKAPRLPSSQQLH